MFTSADLVALNRVQTVTCHPSLPLAIASVDRLDTDKQKYVSDLWKIDVETGESEAITRSKFNDRAPKFGADGKLYFLSNRPTEDGDTKHDKRNQVFCSDGYGDPKQLTFEPLGVMSFDVDASGTVFYQASIYDDVSFDELRETIDKRRENGPSTLTYRPPNRLRYWDHWLPNSIQVLVRLSGEREVLATNESFNGWALSPNGNLFYLTEERNESRLPGYSLFQSGNETPILSDDHGFIFGLAVSDEQLAFVHQSTPTDAIGRYNVMLYDLNTKSMTQIAKDHDNRLTPATFGKDGTLWLTGDLEGAHPVFKYDGAFQQVTETKDHYHAVKTVTLSDGSEAICGVRSSADCPPEIFVKRPSDAAAIITNISGYTRPELSVVNHYTESTDGTPIHHRHVRIDDDKKRPLLLWIHGGPLGAWGDVWHWRWNPAVAASAGFHVVCPNPRGSTGFGQKFVDDMFGDVWGGQCYEDVIAVADASCAEPLVDETKTCAMGGSFGGYMTNWIGSQTDRFSCLVTHASIVDNHGFFGTTDSPPWWMHMFQKNPYQDRTSMDQYSPIRFVENWKSPTLIVHGDKDYRVPVTEALTLYDALDYHGVECEMMIFPDENHWILRPENIRAWYDDIFAFINKHQV